MSMKLMKDHLARGLLNAPDWLSPNRVELLVQGGSHARGVEVHDSDTDLYAVVRPPLVEVFPHTGGYVMGFGRAPNQFSTYEHHDVEGVDYGIHSLVKFMHLLTNSHPDILALLFVDDRYVLHASRVGKLLRSKRETFISRGLACRQRDMAKQQIKRAEFIRETNDPRKLDQFTRHGYSTKTAYHAIRLLLEAETLLRTGTIDLEANGEVLTGIRAGEYSYGCVVEMFNENLAVLEATIECSEFPSDVDFEESRALLGQCLEIQYGEISK